MEVIVYAVYFVGLLAVFSTLVVHAFAALPTRLLMRGEHAGRFADLGSAEVTARNTPTAGSRVTTFDVPKARAA